MENLKKQRGVLKGRLSRLQTFIQEKGHETLTLGALESRRKVLEESWKQFQDIQTKIEIESDIAEDDGERALFEDKFFDVEGMFNDIIENQRISTRSRTEVSTVNVNLPKINLPSFEGNYETWTSFSDLFSSLVGSNSNLSEVQKLQYLKAALKGKAADIVSSLPTTAENYHEAWKLLSERYEHKRCIVYTHLKLIFGLKIISDEPDQLSSLLNTVVNNVRALQALQQPVKHWDTWLVYFVCERLDSETRRQWELSLTTSDLPTFEQLRTFLEVRLRSLESFTKETVKNVNKTKQVTSHHVSTSKITSCVVCNENHHIYHCSNFINMSIEDRNRLIKSNKCCYNCLRKGHGLKDCKSGPCRKCNKKHHSLLHYDKVVAPKADDTESISTSPSQVVVSHLIKDKSHHNQVLLSTVLLKVKDAFGNNVQCRALLDSGSQANFITKSLAQKLKLVHRMCTVPILGIGSTNTTQSHGMVNLTLTSNTSEFNMNITAIVIDKITNKLPASQVDTRKYSHLHHLPLADSKFNTPATVELLLGAEVFSQVICGGKVTGAIGSPNAHQTEFGWVVSGRCNSVVKRTDILSHHVEIAIDSQLRQFWEMEHMSDTPAYSQEEKQCISHYNANHYRDATGRFVVSLPFREDASKLGDTRDMAIDRLKQIERKLNKNPAHIQMYKEFIQEYLELGHMEVCPEDELIKPLGQVYYLPHHAVIKDSSTTTKLRVVFDASAKSSTGVSLNDTLMVGPKVQSDLQQVVLRFRLHRIAFTADIAKMYRQILVDRRCWDYQRIVWRMDPQDAVKDYRLKTVTYGTSAAPFLAINTLRQLATCEQSKYPLGSVAALKGFYVDDIMSGADTTEDALILQDQLISLLKTAGMQLRKWSSNEEAILNNVIEGDREMQPLLLFSQDNCVKTLGLHWHPGNDFFSFSVNILPAQRSTKRSILADVARLFDPLGLLAPIIIRAKMMIQTLWLQKLGWDEDVPHDIAVEWIKYTDDLVNIKNLRIPRYVNSGTTSRNQLIGFCDASERAYGAAVYLRVFNGEEGTVHLMCAKTRVAPLKTVSLPRLELLAAYLLTQLIKNVKEALQINVECVHAWTDSTVVLSWISGQPSRWKTFIANRVAYIQDVVSPEFWHHVKSQENPADCSSRGMTALQLVNHSLWWNGPAWLLCDQAFISPKTGAYDKEVMSEERKPAMIALPVMKRQFDVLYKFSSLSKLVRVTSFCLRFIQNCQIQMSSRQCGPLSPKELQAALYLLIKQVQSDYFMEEIKKLKESKEVVTGNIAQLQPFIDADGILRVGGRLKKSQFSFDKKHPILLPRIHHLTSLIVSYEHLKHLHAGPQLLLSVLQQRFWILHGRDVVRQHVRKCVVCIRHRGVCLQQQMADLPSYRVEPTRPFLNCGVDFGGPFTIKLNNLRGRSKQICDNAYLFLVVCMSTKAIHLDLVSDLTTNALLAALHRFVSRRGKCQNIYSDNGSNFVGAARKLSTFFKIHKHQLASSVAEEGIKWNFIPPKTPHFGGLWESAIKSTKYHLRHVVGNQILSFEEFSTLLCQIEACLNSRPLYALSSDPNDLTPLTPGHFLIGSSLLSIPEPDYTSCNPNYLGRWKLVQQLTQHLWKRWKNEYISQLNNRSKWKSSSTNIEVNDLVIIKGDDVIPSRWNLGRVITVHPGSDGKVRVVTLKTANGVYKRPIVKLCKLLNE